MPTPQAIEFLQGFDGAPYPARLTERYDILECLSHNEKSETLLVRAREDGRLCVAKVGAAHAEMQPNILRLAHKGLPAFIEAFEQNDQPVLVRAYAPGISAREAIKNGPLPRQRALDAGLQLCEILAYLHGQKPPVIHRDVKPGNIVLDGGSVYLIDFGIARTYTADADEDTVCFGTRDYAPPEQYGFTQTDTRADIYAFGATLYTLLTGRTEAANTAQALHDAGLRRIVRRCTAFSPDDRYQSIRQVRRALLGVRYRVRRIAAACLCALLLTAGLTAHGDRLSMLLPGTARFADPIMYRAVCAALGREEGARVTKDELAEVTELYLWRDEPVADEAAFEAVKTAWYDTPRALGRLTTLADVAAMPNLTVLWLGAEPEIDLSPLAHAERLTHISLQFMTISDLSVVAKLPRLSELDLAGSRVASLQPIHDCPSLTRLALHDVPCHDFSFLQGLDDFSYVGLFNGDSAAFLQYFRGKSANHLNLSGAPFTRMDWLGEVRDLTVFELDDASLADIAGIDKLLHLKRLQLSGNPRLTDLRPLLGIRTLEQLTVSHDMQAATDAIAPEAAFTILYSD